MCLFSDYYALLQLLEVGYDTTITDEQRSNALAALNRELSILEANLDAYHGDGQAYYDLLDEIGWE